MVLVFRAVLGFQRTGGTKDLGKSTAELLAKMEKKMREEEAAKVEKKKHRNKPCSADGHAVWPFEWFRSQIE